MAKRDLGPLAPVLTPSSKFDASGALVEATLRLVDPRVAASLHGHVAWKTVRTITMPKVPDPWNRRAEALDHLVFANPAIGTLERVLRMRYGALGAWLRSKHRPHTLGVAWFDDLWVHLDALLALTSPPKNLEIDNPQVSTDDRSQQNFDRFLSSKFVADLERIEMRFVNLHAHHWAALRDHKIRRVVFNLRTFEVVWTSLPPRLTIPPPRLPIAKATRAKAEFDRSYLEQELREVPKGIEIVRLPEP